MGWSHGINAEGRHVGYAVRAQCDESGCHARIDRGLAYCCGNMHDGGDHGCGGYFCYEHMTALQLCRICAEIYDATHSDEDD